MQINGDLIVTDTENTALKDMKNPDINFGMMEYVSTETPGNRWSNVAFVKSDGWTLGNCISIYENYFKVTKGRYAKVSYHITCLGQSYNFNGDSFILIQYYYSDGTYKDYFQKSFFNHEDDRLNYNANNCIIPLDIPEGGYCLISIAKYTDNADNKIYTNNGNNYCSVEIIL